MDQRWVNARATGIHVCTVVPSLSTVAIIIDNRTVLPNVFPTSPLQLSLKLYFVNSIKLLVLDSSRSYDTARVGLPTAYIYRYVVVQQLYVPLGRQLSVTPASMGLFPIAMT